jgi:hypothetical protein
MERELDHIKASTPCKGYDLAGTNMRILCTAMQHVLHKSLPTKRQECKDPSEVKTRHKDAGGLGG